MPRGVPARRSADGWRLVWIDVDWYLPRWPARESHRASPQDGNSPMSPVSDRARATQAAAASLQHFYLKSRYGERRGDPGISDFTFGNPQEMPLAGIAESPGFTLNSLPQAAIAPS